MNCARLLLVVIAAAHAGICAADEAAPDSDRDILVTLSAAGAAEASGGAAAPYSKRKRYRAPQAAEALAAELSATHRLAEITRWPIRSLSVICIVYRVPADSSRDDIIDLLKRDSRIDSAQRLQQFATRTSRAGGYDDTYAHLQRSLSVMGVPAAHEHARGKGVRIAVIDSAADSRHEDLRGRVRRTRDFTDGRGRGSFDHGTAVASIIGANANNAAGIVGIAPEAELDVFAACWADADSESATCDSFTLAKSLDALAVTRADIVNFSLSGPHDPLLGRLIDLVVASGSVVVAAVPDAAPMAAAFPASHASVIAVYSGDSPNSRLQVTEDSASAPSVSAPGEKIVVALPSDRYDFRSGSSLAAAHVSGVAALLKSARPELDAAQIAGFLKDSEQGAENGTRSINAERALLCAIRPQTCRPVAY